MSRDDNAILILDYATVMRLLPLDAAIEAVEAAYRAHALGSARLFPVVRERLEGGAVYGIKSGYWPEKGAVGLKVAGSWPANRQHGRETHQATVILTNAETGQLRAVIDGNAVTLLRTTAAGVIGLRTLARSDAQIAAILGAGALAAAQAKALIAAFPHLSEVRIWARTHEQAERLADSLQDAEINAFAVTDVAVALDQSDIVITATPSSAPLFLSNFIAPGTHINAMGADTRGKRELPPDLLSQARLIVDDREQSSALGESQPPAVWIDQPATIGEVLLGQRPGRTSSDDITVFDSTGIGLQDLMTAVALYERASQQKAGRWLSWGMSS